MDIQTLDSLADLICGDNGPVYRKGWELTEFFSRAGLPQIKHDGSTRKWWTKNVLISASGNDLTKIITRLASPKEYSGNQDIIKEVLRRLNDILSIEGLQIKLIGLIPTIEKCNTTFELKEDIKEDQLKPQPPPNFLTLSLESCIGEILAQRWEESQLCIDKGAYLSGIIMMGSLLEGILLAVMQKYPKEVNQAKSAPRDLGTNKVKTFAEWSLAQMIDTAHELEWFDVDVHKFSHALRYFRNLIHPYQQYLSRTSPDEDTCKISWLVVQAATNDLAKLLDKN